MFFLFDWILTIFWDSRPVQVAIYTVFDEESEFAAQKCQILEPGGKNQENRILEKFLLIIFLFICLNTCFNFISFSYVFPSGSKI